MTKHIAVAGGNDNYMAIAAQETEGGTINDCLPEYGVILMMQETSEQELIDLASELPTDTHLCHYKSPAGDVFFDAVRAYKKADVFDAYHDMGYTVLSIRNGYGNIKPKLFVDSKQKDS